MSKEMNELLEGIELTDDMLEKVNGGMELSRYHQIVIEKFVSVAKEHNHWEIEQFIDFLCTESPYATDPDYLEAAIKYAVEIW